MILIKKQFVSIPFLKCKNLDNIETDDELRSEAFPVKARLRSTTSNPITIRNSFLLTLSNVTLTFGAIARGFVRDKPNIS